MRAGCTQASLGRQLSPSRTSLHTGGYVQPVVWVAEAAVTVLRSHTGIAACMAGQTGSLTRVHPGLALFTLGWQTKSLRCFIPTLPTRGTHTFIYLALITASRTGKTFTTDCMTGIPCRTVRHTPPLKVECSVPTAATLSVSSTCHTSLTAGMTCFTLATLRVLTITTPSLA